LKSVVFELISKEIHLAEHSCIYEYAGIPKAHFYSLRFPNCPWDATVYLFVWCYIVVYKLKFGKAKM
jgi:hypothetical protein